MRVCEKVTLALILVVLNQVTFRLCLPRTAIKKTLLKNFLNSNIPVTPLVIGKRSKRISINPNSQIINKEIKPIDKKCNLSEIKPSKYADLEIKDNSIKASMQRFDEKNAAKNFQCFSTSLKNLKKAENVNCKFNEIYKKVEQITPRNCFLCPFAPQPEPYCFQEVGTFPEVDYPQDIVELLIPNYWKRLLPEITIESPIANPKQKTEINLLNSNDNAIEKAILALIKYNEKISQTDSETTALPNQVTPTNQPDIPPNKDVVTVINGTGLPCDDVAQTDDLKPVDDQNTPTNGVPPDKIIEPNDKSEAVDSEKVASTISTSTENIDSPNENTIDEDKDTASSPETNDSPEVFDDDMFYTTMAPSLMYDTSNLYNAVDENSFLSPGDFDYIIVKS